MDVQFIRMIGRSFVDGVDVNTIAQAAHKSRGFILKCLPAYAWTDWLIQNTSYDVMCNHFSNNESTLRRMLK